MALTKNQKIAAAVGCVGCLGVIFLVLIVTGGIAFFAMNGGDGTTPKGGTPKGQPVAERPATGGDQPANQPANQPATGAQGGIPDGPAFEIIRTQLAQANELAQREGYSPIGQPAAGAINDDTQEEVGVNLNSGGQYLMIGVCDNDCSDVDLRLMGPDGSEVASDVEADDTPVLQFTSGASGAHRARVIMASCDRNPCAYGVALYAKQ